MQPHGIKILSTSLSTSRGQSGHQYLRISLLVHPTIHNLLTSTSPRMQGWEIRVQTDTLISKCFTCSKLGHNSPQCANDKSCPFCGNAHPLQECELFIPDKPLETNITDYLEKGHTLCCSLCKENSYDHNHSGLERGKCTSYRNARFRKFQLSDTNIPSYSTQHFQNYYKIFRCLDDSSDMELPQLEYSNDATKRPLKTSIPSTPGSPSKPPTNKCQRN